MAFPATFSSLTDDVIALVRLDATDDTAKVQDALNTAYFEAMVENEVLVSSGSATLSANVSTYDLDTATQIARIKGMWLAPSGGTSTSRPLRQVSLERILQARQTNNGIAAAVQPGVVTLYSLSGQNQLDVYPAPQTADTLHFVYVGFPAVLAGSDIPEIPEPYATNLLTYGACVPMAEFKADPQRDYYASEQALWQSKYRQHLNLRRGQPGAFEFTSDFVLPPHDRSTIPAWGV